MPKFGNYPDEHKNNNVFMLLQKQMWENPQQEFFRWSTQSKVQAFISGQTARLEYDHITVREFGIAVNRFANGFQGRGIKPRDPVLLFLPPSAHYFASIMALMKIGAIVLTTDNLEVSEIKEILAESSFKALLMLEDDKQKLIEDIPELEKVVILTLGNPAEKTDISRLLKSKVEGETLEVTKDHEALVNYTLNLQKQKVGVLRDHRYFCAQHYSWKKAHQELLAGAILTPYPLFALQNLLVGLTTTLPAWGLAPDPTAALKVLWEQLQDKSLSAVALPPQHLSFGLKLKSPPKLSLKKIFTRIDISPELHEKWQKLLPHGQMECLFGLPEVEPISFTSSVKKDTSDGLDVGTPDSGVSLKFIQPGIQSLKINDIGDWFHYEVKNNEWGELVVAGENLSPKYYQAEHLNKRCKITDDLGITWHRTGLIAKLSQDNRLILKRGN